MPESNGSNGRDDKGKFALGNAGKPKGAMTNASVKVKEAIYNFLENNIESIQASFDTLKAKEKLQFISELIPYAMPRLQSIQSENQTNITGGITIKWEEPNLQIGQDQSPVSDVQSV
jgi:hypothetical protein